MSGPQQRRRTVPGLPAPDRCLVIGVLNVTPDSFSDGGLYLDTETAVAHGRALAAAGADLIDVGGESTRPGAGRIDAAEERSRVEPVVRALVAAGLLVGIDTTRAEVAAAALAFGAVLVNDVSAGAADPDMVHVVAAARVPYVLMHSRGPSSDMADRAHYTDVVGEVAQELRDCRDAAVAAGVEPDRIVLDPGLGFAKNAEHNWTLLRALPALHALGHPLLIGGSRKAFLGRLLADERGLRPVAEREAATTALTALAAAGGVWAVRVHAPRGSRDAVEVAAALAGTT
ncbi:MAG TPA: dihydropteroate synthase [Sporichthyaceae bacterium]